MAARVAFDSSHVGGDFSSGALTVGVVREEPALGVTQRVELAFEVPRDFHTHNDCVAAAMLLLVGSRYRQATFNFPISTHCAELLRSYYSLDEIGPIDAGLEPRRPGRYVGLCLSGGLDSMAIWELLHRALGDQFKVITADFGGGFAFEAQGFTHFHRDVSCRTTFRKQHIYDGARFVFAVPLLFAEYAELGAVTTGHHFAETPLSIDRLRDGSHPSYLDANRSLHAGGLDEVHLSRALNAAGLLQLGLLADPGLQEACFHGSAPRGTFKHFDKGVVLRVIHERRGRALPPWLRDIALPRRPERFAGGSGLRFLVLYAMRFLGPAVMRPHFEDIDRYDLSFLDGMNISFMERYNTNFMQYVPDDLRSKALAVLHEAGIEPYREQDWQELDDLTTFNLALNEERVPMRAPPGVTSARSSAVDGVGAGNARPL